MTEDTLLPFYVLPFPTYESALKALDQCPPHAYIEEVEGKWLLIVPAFVSDDE